MKKLSLSIAAFLFVGYTAQATEVVCGSSDTEVNNKIESIKSKQNWRVADSTKISQPSIAMIADKSKAGTSALICVTVSY